MEQHLVHGVLRSEDFKIVYVAPMKALAAEVFITFWQLLAEVPTSSYSLTYLLTYLLVTYLLTNLHTKLLVACLLTC